MSTRKTILIPDHVEAYQFGTTLTIVASGTADGVIDIKIKQSLAQIFPPIFYVEGIQTDAIAIAPYTVRANFQEAPGLTHIFMRTSDGSNEVPVIQITEADLAKKISPAVTSLKADAPDDEVIGISPNSFDVNRAISNAAAKLQKKYPANVSATLVETGIVAVGTPVGIAYLYVKMKQQSS